MVDAAYGCTAGAWFALVRRARIGAARKAAALVVGSYANADGTGIHCGVARLAVDLEVGYSTARRYLAWLRDVGLVELVRAGNRRRGLSDEYRLILGPELLENLDVPDPAAYDEMRDNIRENNRAGSERRTQRLRSPRPSAEPQVIALTQGERNNTTTADPSALTVQSAENHYLRSPRRSSALTQGEPPPTLNTYPQLHTYPKNRRDLRTDLTVVGHPPPKKSNSGNGFCLPCYRQGSVTLGDPDQSECRYHRIRRRPLLAAA